MNLHDLDIVETYFRILNDPTRRPFPPLIFAVYQENFDHVEFLVSMGADVNLSMSTDDPREPRTAFLMALHRDFGDIAIYLLENNADHTQLDARNNNALLSAFKANNWKLIRYLLEHNKYCNPRAKNIDGDSFFDLILEIRTELPENLPLDLRDQAEWVHRHPRLVNKILLWSDDSLF